MNSFMHEFMFRYCPSHCYLLHKFTSGYHNDACFGLIFDAKMGTLLLYPVYYENSGHVPFQKGEQFYPQVIVRKVGEFEVVDVPLPL